MKQMDTSKMPPVIYAMLGGELCQVVVFQTGHIPIELTSAIEKSGHGWGNWTHWGTERTPHGTPGETVYTLAELTGSRLVHRAHFCVDSEGKCVGGGGGGGHIDNWVTDLRGVSYRWREHLENAAADRNRIIARAKNDQRFLLESLELFRELPYGEGRG